ncbi:MAG: hypothetical protein LBQ66_05185 [Planctomycetaceae bacterium]|nr:hypothetical protein [Planctomycetaceae bacterium]
MGEACPRPNGARIALVIVRWVTDRRTVTSAQADNWIAKNTPPKPKRPYVLGNLVLQMRFGDPVVGGQ